MSLIHLHYLHIFAFRITFGEYNYISFQLHCACTSTSVAFIFLFFLVEICYLHFKLLTCYRATFSWFLILRYHSKHMIEAEIVPGGHLGSWYHSDLSYIVTFLNLYIIKPSVNKQVHFLVICPDFWFIAWLLALNPKD